MKPRILHVRRLGRMDYAAAYQIQRETEQQVKLDNQPDTLLLVEHPHVITIGRRADASAIHAAPEVLAASGVTVFESNRGGKATYHGIGQLVGYPIIKLSPDREDVHKYVRDLEQVLILALRDFGIEGFRIPGLTGVHAIHHGRQGKLAAIGVHIARWVTTHGFALNVNTDLSFYNLITACEGEPVASMHNALGRTLDLAAVEKSITKRFAEVFEMTVGSFSATEFFADESFPIKSFAPGILETSEF